MPSHIFSYDLVGIAGFSWWQFIKFWWFFHTQKIIVCHGGHCGKWCSSNGQSDPLLRMRAETDTAMTMTHITDRHTWVADSKTEQKRAESSNTGNEGRWRRLGVSCWVIDLLMMNIDASNGQSVFYLAIHLYVVQIVVLSLKLNVYCCNQFLKTHVNNGLWKKRKTQKGTEGPMGVWGIQRWT
jgi:hypothetical protein